MDKLQDRQYTMFLKVNVFAIENHHYFPDGSVGRRLLDEIAAGLAEIKKVSPSQLGDIRDARLRTNDKTGARKALIADLRRIIRTARLIADSTPGFDAPYKLPKSEGDAALLYTARQFVERARPSADVFIRFSMPAAFIDDLNTYIRNIEQATDNRAKIRARHKEATAAIDAVMTKCMKAVADFDVIAANTLRDDPVTLSLWKSVRHVKRAPRKKKADDGD